MVGSGIASASRKPAGSRGSWLRQGRAGYLSPRPLCAHNIYTVASPGLNVCNPGRGRCRVAKAVPVGQSRCRSTSQADLGASCHAPIASGFARGLRALGAMSILSRWSRQTGLLAFSVSWSPWEPGLGWTGPVGFRGGEPGEPGGPGR